MESYTSCPFSTLVNGGHYLLSTHLVTVAPSGTVLHILSHRANEPDSDDLPYVGVAAVGNMHGMLQSVVQGETRKRLEYRENCSNQECSRGSADTARRIGNRR
jgi:hypothetical protein